MKDFHIKSQKIDTPPPCPQNSTLAQPPGPCGRTIKFKKSKFFAPKSVDVRI